MKKIALLLLTMAAPVAPASAQETTALADDSYLLQCFVEQSPLVDGQHRRPPNKTALLLGVQFEADAPGNAPVSRLHDPNNLIGTAKFDEISLQQSEHGRVLFLAAKHGDGSMTVLTLAMDHRSETGFPASVGGRSSEGVSLDSKPFYAGACQLMRPRSGSNLGFEAMTQQEPTLEMRVQ